MHCNAYEIKYIALLSDYRTYNLRKTLGLKEIKQNIEVDSLL